MDFQVLAKLLLTVFHTLAVLVLIPFQPDVTLVLTKESPEVTVVLMPVQAVAVLVLTAVHAASALVFTDSHAEAIEDCSVLIPVVMEERMLSQELEIVSDIPLHADSTPLAALAHAESMLVLTCWVDVSGSTIREPHARPKNP